MADRFVVAGVDVGSLNTPRYVVWLYNRRFTLDLFGLTRALPLSSPPAVADDVLAPLGRLYGCLRFRWSKVQPWAMRRW